MFWQGKGMIQLERGEPGFRSCWMCNGAHEHLKKVNTLHLCFSCNRYWVFDQFLDELKSDKEFDDFFEKQGMKVGDSTTTIDRGYRVTHVTVVPENKIH